MKFLKEGYMDSFREIEDEYDIQNQLWDNPTFNAILNKYGILKDNIELEIYGDNSIHFTATVPGENYLDLIEFTDSDIKTFFKDPFIRNNIEEIYNPKTGEYEGEVFFNLKPAKPIISENHLYYVMHNVIDWIRDYSPRDKRSIIQIARACHRYDDDYSTQEYAKAIKFYNALDDFKRNKREKSLKEDYEEFYFKYPTRYLSYRKNLWDKIHGYNLNLEDAGELSQVSGDRDSLLKFVDDLSLDISPEDLHLKESLKEDIDPKTNDTDDLYAVWYPYVGKRIVTKDIMIRELEGMIENIKRGSHWNVGEGLAFRCIQAIDDGEPLVPNRSDEEFFKAMHWED